jgi:hypothetical protein
MWKGAGKESPSHDPPLLSQEIGTAAAETTLANLIVGRRLR